MIMTKVRSQQQSERNDGFWNQNHEQRRSRVRKADDKKIKTASIRDGIDDYFEVQLPSQGDASSSITQDHN